MEDEDLYGPVDVDCFLDDEQEDPFEEEVDSLLRQSSE